MLFDVTRFIPPKRNPTKKAKPKPRKPLPNNHPYKYGQSLYSGLDYTLKDHEIMEMLEDAFLKWVYTPLILKMEGWHFRPIINST